MLAVLCAGCGQPPDQEAQLLKAYVQTAKLCSESFPKAERARSPYMAQEMWLTETGEAQLEACLRASDRLVVREGQ